MQLFPAKFLAQCLERIVRVVGVVLRHRVRGVDDHVRLLLDDAFRDRQGDRLLYQQVQHVPVQKALAAEH